MYGTEYVHWLPFPSLGPSSFFSWLTRSGGNVDIGEPHPRALFISWRARSQVPTAYFFAYRYSWWWRLPSLSPRSHLPSIRLFLTSVSNFPLHPPLRHFLLLLLPLVALSSFFFLFLRLTGLKIIDYEEWFCSKG